MSVLCAPCGGVYPCADCRERWYRMPACDYSARTDNDLDTTVRVVGRVYPTLLSCLFTGPGWALTATNQSAQVARDASRYAGTASPTTRVLGLAS